MRSEESRKYPRGNPVILSILFLSFGLGLFLSACSGRESDRKNDWLGHVDTLESGRVHISNPRVGLWSATEVPLLEEDLRIGALEGDGPNTFGAIPLFEVGEENTIWVYDEHSREIRVFDRRGRFLRTVGGPGAGPGEFEMVIGMSWAPGEGLWVLDFGSLTFSIFDASGVFLRGQRIEGGAVMIPWPGGFDRFGRLYHYARRPRKDGTGNELVMVRYEGVDAGLEPSDTLLIPRFDRVAPFELRAGRRYMSVPVPFTPSPVWHLSPSGEIWCSGAADYSLHHLGPDGDTLLTISKASSPASVTKQEMDEAMHALRPFVEAGGRIEPGRIPKTKPAISDFVFDDQQRIWVVPFGEEKRATPAIDVFDGEGRYLGPVSVPFSFRMAPAPIIRGEWFYAVTTDDFDVPFVVRARIKEARGSAESVGR